MKRRTFVDKTGAHHTFDYLQRTAIGPSKVNTHNVIVWASQAAVLKNSADHAEIFFRNCAAHPQWSCGNYSTIFVAVGQWVKLFLNNVNMFHGDLDLLLSNLRRHQPRARIILRLPTPAMCQRNGDYCNSSRFSFQPRYNTSVLVHNASLTSQNSDKPKA